jgi:hypothetical protein
MQNKFKKLLISLSLSTLLLSGCIEDFAETDKYDYTDKQYYYQTNYYNNQGWNHHGHYGHGHQNNNAHYDNHNSIYQNGYSHRK